MPWQCSGGRRVSALPCLLCLRPAGIVRASSIFPILSTILLLLGGLCIGAGRFYSRKNNIVLSAGILFVAAGERALAPLHRAGTLWVTPKVQAGGGGGRGSCCFTGTGLLSG